jgi:hypothetical protein
MGVRRKLRPCPSTGVSTVQAAADAARAFFSSSYSVGAFLPAGVSISFDPTVDVLEEVNGELTSTVPVTAPGTITGSGNARYAAVAGACVTWRTGDFVGGRRVRGRTFLVPVDGGALGLDGSLDDTFRGFINTAAAALVASAPEFVIWRRPTSHAAADGSAHIVGSGSCQDKTAFLTSRR